MLIRVWCQSSSRTRTVSARLHLLVYFIEAYGTFTDKTAASSPVFKTLAKKGVVLTNFDAITHPSQPNYVAVVSGDTQGVRSDDNSWYQNPPIDPSVETIVDLLESKSISWATYAENMPTDGFRVSASLQLEVIDSDDALVPGKGLLFEVL